MSLLDWFRSRPRQDEPTEEWWERLAQLEGDMKQLQLEWENTFGKVRRALAALAKRQERGEEEEGAPENGVAASRHSSPGGDFAEAQRLGLLGRRH